MNQLQTVETEVAGQRALFDYAALDQETQVVVRLRASEIKGLAKRMASDVVDIGGKLAEVKDRIGGNGKFNDWLSAELGWSERTAYNFIAVWQRFGAANFALENVATSALYLLAAPSTPAEAVEVAKQIADSGEEVTHGMAKEIVRQAKERQPRQEELIEEPGEVEEETEPEEDAGEGEAFTEFDPALHVIGAEPIKVLVSQEELDEMDGLNSAAEIDRGRAARLIHRGDESFVITDSAFSTHGRRETSAIGWLVKPEREAGDMRLRNHPADLVDEVPGYAETYLGVRINAGSKAQPEWWVVAGPAYEFALEAPDSPAAVAETEAPISQPAPAAKPAPRAEAAQKRPVVATPSTAAGARPAAWFKSRIEITITLMPGPEPRKIMHSVRAGDSPQDIPFVAVSSGEAELLDVLPPITRGLYEKAAEAFAKKQTAKPAKKPTSNSKPAAKKPAAKSTKKGGKK